LPSRKPATSTVPLLRVVVGMMPHVSRLDDEDDVLGDIRRVIADAFKAARDQNQVDSG
jgi:hypothetical protein